MQTLDFTGVLRQIVQGLKIPELTSFIRPLISTGANAQISQDQKNRFAALLFDSNAAFRGLTTNPVTHRIVSALGVDQFYEPSRLLGMLNAISSVQNANQIVGNTHHFANFYSFSELLQSLQRLENVATDLLEKQKIGEVPPSDGILDLELIEYSDEVGFSPRRIELLAKTIVELHMNLALALSIEGDKVVFGSGYLTFPQAFDFLDARAERMEGTNQIACGHH